MENGGFDSWMISAGQRLLRLLGCVPLAVGQAAGRLAGRLIFAVDGRHRRIVLDNLNLALGDELTADARRRLARRAFMHLGQLPFELGWSLRLEPARWPLHFRIDGWQHVRAALIRGKGC